MIELFVLGTTGIAALVLILLTKPWNHTPPRPHQTLPCGHETYGWNGGADLTPTTAITTCSTCDTTWIHERAHT